MDTMSKKIKDLTGQRFRRLLVIEDSGKRNKWGKAMWRCKCDCGNMVTIYSGSLSSGHTKSCGCLNREMASIRCRARNNNLKHGDARQGRITKLYGVWTGMKERCSNSLGWAYKYYGGKGISICDEWKEYTPFKIWALNNGYDIGLTIDRIDNNDNYRPGNCQWITQAENTIKDHLGKRYEKRGV